MKLKIFLAVLVILAVVGGLAGVKTMQIQKMIAAGKAYTPPPETVTSAVAQEVDWQGALKAIGTITAVQGVEVAAEISGTIREIAFESGAVVAKDDLLVRLDIAAEEAQLRGVLAQVELARINLERARALRAQNTVSQSELDTAEATLKQHLASADAIRAAIDKKTIRAPFAGRLGLRLVNLGQYLQTGQPIVSLQALSPAYADFSLPQRELARLRVGLQVRLETDAYPDRTFAGTLTAINPDLDASTRSVALRATVENEEELLRPGMFVRAEVLLPESRKLLVIPATAVLSAPYGASVYLIEPATNGAGGLVVRQQFIRTGIARGDFISVESGLKPGDRLVSAGIFKLRNGMAVVENNEVAPKPQATPRPAEG